MDPGVSALIVVAILVASALIFTFVFIFVADRKLAEPSASERREREPLRREDRENSPPEPGTSREDLESPQDSGRGHEGRERDE